MVVSFPKILLVGFGSNHKFICTPEETLPVSEQLRRVLDNPFVPEQFQPDWGGPAHLYMPKEKRPHARAEWMTARLHAVASVLKLLIGRDMFYKHFAVPDISVPGDEKLRRWLKENGTWLNRLVSNRLSYHEQLPALLTSTRVAEQLLVPFQWQEAIFTATEWEAFFQEAAWPNRNSVEFEKLVQHMRDAYTASTPTSVGDDQKHSIPHPVNYLDLSDHEAVPFAWGEWNVRRAAARLYQRLGGSREWAGDRIENLMMSVEFHGKLRGWRQLK